MLTTVLALPLAAHLAAAAGFAPATQSQFTRPSQPAETMRFQHMDRNRDGVITRAEWRGSDRAFRVHDWNNDGILSGDEVHPGALRDGARDADEGIWDDREDTFENLDANENNLIERHEWHASADAFDWLDRNRDGVLSRGEVVGGSAERRAVARGTRNPRDPRAAATGTAGRQDCVDNAAKVVDDIYQQVLERPADAGSAAMTQALASGRTTVRDIVRQVAKSEEHARRYFWQPLATNVYRQILDRQPSEQELRQITSDLASGRTQLIDVIARTVRRASSSDEEAVRTLYRRLLKREADPQGLRGFTELAQREGIEAVAREIRASAEYRQQTGRTGLAVDDAAYDAAVRSLYRHVLGREPDAGGLRDLTYTAAASGFDAVVDRMIDSDEYQRLYGADAVPGRGIRYCGPAADLY